VTATTWRLLGFDGMADEERAVSAAAPMVAAALRRGAAAETDVDASRVQLTVDSTDPEVVGAIERAAAAAGVQLERLEP
jgi:ribosomal protein L7/L12